MIKAVGTDHSGNPQVILGLAAENIRRLQAHDPIVVDMAELGLSPLTVIIVDASDPAVVQAFMDRIR